MSTRLEQLTNEQKRLFNTARESEKAVVNKTADTNRQTITDDYNAQIANTEQSYDELIDQNAVQKIINERKIAENMAQIYKLCGKNGEPPILCASSVDIYTNFSKMIFPMRWDNADIIPEKIDEMTERYAIMKSAAESNYRPQFESQDNYE